MRPMVRGSGALVLVIAASVLMSGCGGADPDMGSSLSVSDAKVLTQQTETKIIDSLPRSKVVDVRRVDPGVLMSCSAEGLVNWAGGATVTTTGDIDFDAVLRSIQDRFDADGEYLTELATRDGAPRLTIQKDGANWISGPLAGGTEFHISSFSPCFPLPEGTHPSDKY